jgi:hypothetical protein
MKQMIKITQLITILLFGLSTFSQSTVTVGFQDLQYTNNGQPTISVANCGNIDLASSTSTTINFGINLSKPKALVVGNGNVKVFTKNSSGDVEVVRQTIPILSSSWTDTDTSTTSTTASISLNSSDFNLSDGSLYVAYISSSDTRYQTTCSYTITKAQPPIFTLSPSTVSVPCGSTAPITFTASNVYNSSGVLNYYWNVGAGWTISAGTYATSTNTLSLTPASYPPSNVSVTPNLDGKNYPQKTASITLAPFTSTATISGNSSICSGTSTYSLSGLLANQTVTWSLSNSSIATLGSTNGASTTLTNVAQGTVKLTAMIINTCNQTTSITRDIIVGSPMPLIDNFTCASESTPCFLNATANYNYLIFNLSAPIGNYTPLNTDWQWEKISGNFFFLENGQYNSATATGRQGNIYLTGANPTNNPLKFRCRVKNACGWGNWRNYEWNDGTTTPVVPPTPAKYYTVSPNPATTFTVISLRDPNIKPITNGLITAKLYSIYGQLLYTSQIVNNSGSFYVSGLINNTYYATITFDNYSESHTIVKQ